MIEIKANKPKFFIFLTALVLSLFLTTSGYFLKQAHLLLVLPDITTITSLKIFSICLQIVFPIILLFILKKKSFEKFIKLSLYISIGIISLFFTLMLFQQAMPLDSNYGSILKKLPSMLFFISLQLINTNFFFLIIWGFINHFTTLSEGIKYYLPLIFFLRIFETIIWGSSVSLSMPVEMLTLSSILLMTLALITLNWAFKRLPKDIKETSESSVTLKNEKFPYLPAAFLLAVAGMVEKFLHIYSKGQFPGYVSSLNFNQLISTSIANSEIFVLLLASSLGAFLLIKRGWHVTALLGSLAVFLSTISFFDSTYTSSLAYSESLGITIGLLKGTSLYLFFPLVQILYLNLPVHLRMNAKIVTEMIALPIFQAIPVFVLLGLIESYSLKQISSHLEFVILALLAMQIVASVVCSRSSTKPSQEAANL